MIYTYEFLENVNIYCFDVEQYNYYAERLTFVVMANYEGKTYLSGDVIADPVSCCNWDGYKWSLNYNVAAPHLMVYGCIHIKDCVLRGVKDGIIQ